jgi:hypothetical protein
LPLAFGGNIGSAPGGTASLTFVTFNTTALVPAGGLVVVVLAYFKGLATVNPSGITIGGNAMTNNRRTPNGSDVCEVWSYYSAAGLASAVAVTATWPDTNAMGGRLMGAMYFTGAPSTGFFDIGAGTTGTGASLSSGSATNTVNATDSVYVGAIGLEDATNPTTSIATAGTEVHDLYDVADGQGMWSGYLLVSSSAARAITATASNSASTSNTGALAIYAGTGGAPPAVIPSLLMAPLLPT